MGKKKQEKGTSDDSNSTSSCSTVSDKRVLTLNSIMSEENTGPVHSPKIYQMGPPPPADQDAAFKSPGVEMAFTPAQWRELEKQAMIYKYIIASVPVPPDLLFSVISSRTDDPYSYPYPYPYPHPYPYPYFPWLNGNLRNNKDLEPGRCKRTDGKKWRCSRDVAPHQKYCERHMHRGRPRSRKHVEIHQTSVENGSISAAGAGGGGGGGVKTTASAAKKSRLQVDPPPRFFETHKPKEPLYVDPPSIFPPSDHFKQSTNRVFGWEMEGGNTEQQWQEFMDTKRGMDTINGYSSVLQQGYEQEVQIQEQQPLSLFSYGGTGMESIDDQCRSFLNSDHHQKTDNNPTRGFIDAWSTCTGDMKSTIPASSSSSSNLNLWPPCDDTLTLSMAFDAAGMGHGQPVSWQPFHSGGPLAEVLGPISPPGTSASSPRGILHRAVFSQSDGSVGNSPTLAASKAAPDLVAYQWLN